MAFTLNTVRKSLCCDVLRSDAESSTADFVVTGAAIVEVEGDEGCGRPRRAPNIEAETADAGGRSFGSTVNTIVRSILESVWG